VLLPVALMVMELLVPKSISPTERPGALIVTIDWAAL